MGVIVKVSGPLIVATNMPEAKMHDVVKVSAQKLVGEIVELRGDLIYIQVYEETEGIGPGGPVTSTNHPLQVELGPGLIGAIYDGIQRPLDSIMDNTGDLITRGIDLPSLDRKKKWHFTPQIKTGTDVSEGDIIGIVQETPLVAHKIMVPPGLAGIIEKIQEGDFTIEEPVAVLRKTANEKQTADITMLQRWPVRKERPYKNKMPPNQPLVTGQRVIDTFFPVAKGGTACVPGPFGSGKTIVQHQLAKWSDADIVVYVGCGERGNEMCDVLTSFPKLKDPRSGLPLINRTVMIANTSNMPVAAREASIYTGITIAEYFRDMGYSVVLLADSTSRWAEALREMSGRLEELPGEEGYPAYLPVKLAEFYERAGKIQCLGSSNNREGALSVVGAISPPGGDLSDPVVQATLKVVQVFWSLEDWLAYERHFPAINWLNSYSLYIDNITEYMANNISPDFIPMQKEAITLLQKEAELKEIAKLVGVEALSNQDRLLLETAKSIREDFLHQNAFHEIDTYTSLKKQYLLLKIIMRFHKAALSAVKNGADIETLINLPVREQIARAKYTAEDKIEDIKPIEGKIKQVLNTISQ